MKPFCQHCLPSKRRSHVGPMLTWYTEHAAEFMATPYRVLAGSRSSAWTGRINQAIMDLLAGLKMVTYDDAPNPEKLNRRGRIFFDEAKRRGFNIRAVKIFNRYTNEYLFCHRGRRHLYQSNPLLIWEPMTMFDEKRAAKKLLKKHELPHAHGDSFFQAKPAIEFARTLNWPLVVKPDGGSLSHHATYPVEDEAQLKDAIRIAKEYQPAFVVEEFVEGDLYRGTVIDQEHVFVCRKDPASKTDDDGSNKAVLALGCRVINCTSETHPDNIELFKQIARAAEMDLVGIDFICPDIKKSWQEQKTAVIELNSLPYIDMHQFPDEGASERVDALVWDVVLKKLEPSAPGRALDAKEMRNDQNNPDPHDHVGNTNNRCGIGVIAGEGNENKSRETENQNNRHASKDNSTEEEK